MTGEVESGTTVEPTAPQTAQLEADASTKNSSDVAIEPQTFDEMGLRPEVKQALTEMGFVDPMPVQKTVWHPMMAGRDIMVQSRTGSGKTAAFAIPMAQGLVKVDGGVQALALAPTRELALQVAKECEKITQYVGLSVVPIYGGAPMPKQVDALKAGAQIVAGTPGRVLDHLRRGTLRLDGLKILVLDECDEMLSMGFLEEITEIIKRCPSDRQTVLFSATIPDDIERIGSRYMRAPEKFALSADFVGVHEIHHVYYLVSGMGRTRDLVRVLESEKPESAIIFCNTREDTTRVSEFLRKSGYDAEAISSDLTQKDRERVMTRMKEKNLKFLVATDIAARGIDISDLGHVINYTFPESAEVYVHRTGRTGRAGKSGVAISLVSPRELGNFYMLKLTYKIRPEERMLPSEEQVRATRESGKLDELRARLGGEEPAAEWRQLARRLSAAEDGERLVARLLEEQLRPRVTSAPVAIAPLAAPSIAPTVDVVTGLQPTTPVEARNDSGSRERPERGERRGRRERGRRGGGRDERPREGRDQGRDQPRQAQPQHGQRPAQPSRPASSAPRVTETIDTSGGREFWEAWVDSKTDGAAAPATTNGETAASESPSLSHSGETRAPREARERRPRPERTPLDPGQVRLYLNLGRRDGLDDGALAAFLTEKALTPIRGELHSSHTYLIVNEADEAPTIATLQGSKRGERDLVCERARK